MYWTVALLPSERMPRQSHGLRPQGGLRMRGFKLVLLAFALVVRVPMGAFAQATLSGLVRDTSGAVLPGATVEASSPVLIEKVRPAVTDDTGRYTILDLRPGAYRVAFTLPGFRTTVREGVELAGTQTTTINA